MTSFLLEYNRHTGALQLTRFEDAAEAMHMRMQREANVADEVEVVVLSSDSEESLRRTHSRYFQTVSEILRSSGDALRAQV